MTIKVWYPGPSVDPAEQAREQAHLTLGILKPGWNDVDEDAAMAPLAAGLVALEAPAPQKAVAPKVKPEKQSDTAPLALDKE